MQTENMTLQGYCGYLGWDAAELSRKSGIAPRSARKALKGEEISFRVARDIADALSLYTGNRINVGDIQGLNIS